MNTTDIHELHRRHFEPLFKRVAPQYARRWLTLLGEKPAKWAKIKPWQAWPCDVYESFPPGMEWKDMVDKAVKRANGRKHALMLVCGHSPDPRIEEVPLALLKDRLCGTHEMRGLQEGFVSLVPGELALGVNHEGGFWLIDEMNEVKQ